jgi:hypothetical protein
MLIRMGSVAAALRVATLPVADWSGTPLLHPGIGWCRRAAHQQQDSWIAEEPLTANRTLIDAD